MIRGWYSSARLGRLRNLRRAGGTYLERGLVSSSQHQSCVFGSGPEYLDRTFDQAARVDPRWKSSRPGPRLAHLNTFTVRALHAI